jgi:hypothetical protein
MERPAVKIINSSMVLVSWKPPQNPGGPLNYYEVTAIKVDEKSVKNETHMYNTTGMRLQVICIFRLYLLVDSLIFVKVFGFVGTLMAIAQILSMSVCIFC